VSESHSPLSPHGPAKIIITIFFNNYEMTKFFKFLFKIFFCSKMIKNYLFFRKKLMVRFDGRGCLFEVYSKSNFIVQTIFQRKCLRRVYYSRPLFHFFGGVFFVFLFVFLQIEFNYLFSF
jgi:hypothetical protein